MLSWRTADAAAAVAAEIGASPRETVYTAVGGNTPQMLVNQAALAIQNGEVDVVLIAGAEAMYTRTVSRRTGEAIEWPKQEDGLAPTRVVGSDKPGTHDAEMAAGLAMPSAVYPVIESAVRAAQGLDVDTHIDRIAELWSRFSSVASKNPNAWTPTARSAAEIKAATPDNRMVAFPYTKYLNANLTVDQAAALILCSAEAAESAGVPRDRWVFPWSGADASDQWFVSEREDLDRSPAIAACGRKAFGLAGIGVDDIGHIDLYSCFPVAVEIGARELGIDAWDASRVPTVTGGLAYAGGPGNNYVTHSIAALADRLRAEPGAIGLITALGWYVTKHSVGVWSSEPPRSGSFKAESVQGEVDAGPKREVVTGYEGPAAVAGYTVMYDRDNAPASGMAIVTLPDGSRTAASTTDADALKGMTTEELNGRPVTVSGSTFALV